MATVDFSSVSKVYPDGTTAVDKLSLDVQAGEFLVLVGPSGCGKTSALRMCAGLEDVSAGELIINGNIVNNVPARQRDIAMVFQNYALYPHMSVFENIAFPLRSQRVPRAEVRTRVEAAAKLIGLTEHLHRKPRNLSGGQRQRVAMGRAVVRRPQVFLMDEPLSNLDAKLRVQMRAEISETQRTLGITTIYVTHDQVEAMTMGHRIAVMNGGVLQQVGTPQEVYDRPDNLFVAQFVGTPGMSLFKVRISAQPEGICLQIGSQSVELSESSINDRLRSWLVERSGGLVGLGVRPENLHSPQEAKPDLPRVEGIVTLVENLGSHSLVHVALEAEPVTSAGVEPESDRLVEHRVTAVALFRPTSTPHVGAHQSLAIDPGNLHFFDLETGLASR